MAAQTEQEFEFVLHKKISEELGKLRLLLRTKITKETFGEYGTCLERVRLLGELMRESEITARRHREARTKSIEIYYELVTIFNDPRNPISKALNPRAHDDLAGALDALILRHETLAG